MLRRNTIRSLSAASLTASASRVPAALPAGSRDYLVIADSLFLPQAGLRLKVRGNGLILEGRGRVFGIDGRKRPPPGR